MRKQTAIYWARTTIDVYGQYSYEAPVQIDCRWDEVQDKFITPEGNEEVSKAVVYVDRDMSVGDYLKLGTLDSATVPNPLNDEDAFGIQNFSKISNLKNTEYLRTCHL